MKEFGKGKLVVIPNITAFGGDLTRVLFQLKYIKVKIQNY